MTGRARTIALLISLGVLLAATVAGATDNPAIERLATCQDSWVEWKENNPAQLQKFVTDFSAQFLHKKDTDPFLVPKSGQNVIGLPVAQVFPESVGMGVGFSVMVKASFEKTRSALERKIGKTLKQCERGENMRTCALQLAEKKTITMISEDKPNTATTLFGCYYFYEK